MSLLTIVLINEVWCGYIIISRVNKNKRERESGKERRERERLRGRCV